MSTLALPVFNPMKFANRLKQAGIPEKQAEAEAEVLHEALVVQVQAVSELEKQVKTLTFDVKRDAGQMATKADIAELRTSTKADIAELRASSKADIAELRASSKADIAELRASSKADIAELRASTKADIAELRASTKTDIAQVRGDIKLLRWMLGILIAGVSAIAAAVVPPALRAYVGG